MIAVVPLLHEIVPNGWTRMALLEPDATMGRGYSENPAMGFYVDRFWELANDPSGIVGSMYRISGHRDRLVFAFARPGLDGERLVSGTRGSP